MVYRDHNPQRLANSPAEDHHDMQCTFSILSHVVDFGIGPHDSTTGRHEEAALTGLDICNPPDRTGSLLEER